MGQRGPLNLRANLRRVMEAKGLRVRDVVTRLPQQHEGTAYNLLAGRTIDPRINTTLELCRALDVDPDELLGTAPPPLEPELQELLDAAQGLSDDDKRLVLDMLRAIRRGQEARREGQRVTQG